MRFLDLFSRDIEEEEDEGEDTENEPIISIAKKKKDTMDSVLQVTVLETILNDFRQLKIAKIDYNNDEMFIGLMLRAEDIGGLNRKSSKDRSEMIQQISGGDIKVYISDELLKKEELLLIPDAETWENIGEYKFMREASYTIQFLDEEGTIYDTKQKASYAEIEDAIKNQKNLSTLVKQMPNEVKEESTDKDNSESNEEQHKEEAEQDEIDQSIEENAENVEEDLNTIPEDDIDLNEVPEDEEEPDLDEEKPDFGQEEEDVAFLDEYENNNMETQDDDFVSGPFEIPDDMQVTSVSDIMDNMGGEDEDIPEEDSDSYDQGDWSGEDEEDEEDEYSKEDVDVSEDDVESTIYRKFYSDELELEISMIPFNSKFVNSSDIIPFETDRPEGWMNEQLNEKSKHYNHEIKQMHQTNLSRLRIIYTNLMQDSVDDIRKSLDINTASNKHGEKFQEIKTIKEGYDIESAIEDERRKITQNWEKELEEIGATAAQRAIENHKQKYERQYEDRLFTADTYIRDKLENEYQELLRKLNNTRKIEAHQQLEVYTNSVLQKVAEEYLTMQDKETERIHEMQKELERFMDEHRKDDIAMAEVKKNEQRYKQRLDEQLEIHRAEIENYKRELEQKEIRYRAEMENSSLNYKKLLNEKEVAYETEISKLKNKNTELKEAYDELNEKYLKVDETKRTEYENQIEQIRSANIALEEEMRAKDIENKRKLSGTIILIIVCAIAALAVGFMIGTVM